MQADSLKLAAVDAAPDEGRQNPLSDSASLVLTRTDLAGELRTSVKSVDRLDDAGKLPRAIRVGHCRRWLRSEIVAWLAMGAPDRKTFEAATGGPRRAR